MKIQSQNVSNKANYINNQRKVIKMEKTILATVTFSFRPQVVDSEDFSKVEGAVYHEYELDNEGNPVMVNGEPKLIMARKKPAVRRAPVVAELQYPTLESFGISPEVAPYALDSNGFPVYESKEYQLLFNLIRERVESAARDTLENSATVQTDKVDWSVIAVKPKRSTSAVSKEDLESTVEAFTQYLTNEGKQAKGIKFQAQLLKSRCRGVDQYDQKLLSKVLENLGEFTAQLDSATASEHAEVLEYLGGKLADALATEEDLRDML